MVFIFGKVRRDHQKITPSSRKSPPWSLKLKIAWKKLDLIDLSKATKILIFRKSPEKVSSKFKKITWSWSQKVGGPNFKKSVSGIKILVNFLGTPNLVFSAEIKIKRSLLLITVDFFDQVRRFFRWSKPSFFIFMLFLKIFAKSYFSRSRHFFTPSIRPPQVFSRTDFYQD